MMPNPVSTLTAVAGSLGTSARVPRCPEWELIQKGSTALFASSAPVEWLDFDERAQLAFFQFLAEADGLDTSSPARDKQVARVLRRVGAITLEQPRPAPLLTMGPGGAVGPSGVLSTPTEVLAANGVFPVDAAARDHRIFVNWRQLSSQLYLLREGLLLATEIATGQTGWKERVLRFEGPFHGCEGFLDDDVLRLQSSTDRATYIAQMWFTVQLSRPALVVSPIPFGEKIGLAFVPATAAQQAWLTLAATAGFLSVPFPVDSLFTCAYPKCARMFFADRSSARGEHRFCSVRHGKSYHAAIATRTRRARQSAEKRGEPWQEQ